MMPHDPNFRALVGMSLIFGGTAALLVGACLCQLLEYVKSKTHGPVEGRLLSDQLSAFVGLVVIVAYIVGFSFIAEFCCKKVVLWTTM